MNTRNAVSALLFVLALVFSINSSARAGGCIPTGATDSRGNPVTAYKVNQSVIGETIKSSQHGCDAAVYFDENAPSNAVVKNSTIIQDTDPRNTGTAYVSYGVLVQGGNVDVENTNVDSTAVPPFDVFLSIHHEDGASGKILRNDLDGHHRAGIFADDDGTKVIIRNNIVTGSGPQTGWAENGIQVSRGADGVVKNNVSNDHWWDATAFCGSGIMIFGSDDVVVNSNDVNDNDCGISVLAGNGNVVKGNMVTVSHPDATVRGQAGVWLDGVSFGLIGGSNNKVLHNGIVGHTADLNGDVSNPAVWGIRVEDARKTKLIQNDISDFQEPISKKREKDTIVVNPVE